MRPATPTHPEDEKRARGIIARSSLRALWMYMIGWPFGAVPLAAFAWPSADHGRLIAWTAGMTAAGWITAAVGYRAAARDRGTARDGASARDGSPGRDGDRMLSAALMITGVVLALAPVAVRAADDAGMGYLTQLWIVGYTTVLLMVASVPRWPFLALVIPTYVTDALVVGLGRAGLPRGIGPVGLCYLVCLLLGRRRQYRETVQALAGELAGRRLADEVGEINTRLEYRASHDTLTGLASRHAFLDEVESALDSVEPLGLALLVIDVDRFKTINDALGHETGDRLLVEMASHLTQSLRENDLAARHGGDEFTVLLRDVAGEEDARHVADRLRLAMGRSVVVEGQRLTSTVSIGLALNTDREDRASDLLRHADAALYQVKESGRDKVAVFDHTLRASLRKRVSDETELRDALADGQIVAWFQPIVEMSTGSLVGAEALARWIHPDHGVLLPGRFLPLLEDAGLLPALGREMANQVFAFRRDIDAMVPNGFRITLNIGVRDQSIATIIERLVHSARLLGTSPEGIALEITETAVIGDVRAATTALDGARRHGFTVMLDDFGTGYSSLALLRDLQLDALKIDQTFVRGMASPGANAAIVAGVLDLARRLDLYVVAEGVETLQDVTRLRAEDAVFGQGFHWSPAVPPQDFLQFLGGHLPWIAPGATPPPLGTTRRTPGSTARTPGSSEGPAAPHSIIRPRPRP